MMAKPITQTFEGNKQQIIQSFPKVISALNMQMVGCHKRLGLISFHRPNGEMLYAHVADVDKQETKVAIAPGLPNLKEHDRSQVPESEIANVLKRLHVSLKN